MPKYCYSTDGETFHGDFTTIEEAAAAAAAEFQPVREDDGSAIVWVGEAERPTIGRYLSIRGVENLLESLAEQAFDEIGEFAEGWLSGPTAPGLSLMLPKDQRNALIQQWRKDRAEWLEPLTAAIHQALETWATEQDEQPRFFRVTNIIKCRVSGGTEFEIVG